MPPAESLIARIRAAGGRLAVDTATYLECTRLDAQIWAIRRFGKLAAGFQLISEQPTWNSRVLTITPLPEWMTAEPLPVPVPGQLRAAHAAIAALRDSERLPVTGPPPRPRSGRRGWQRRGVNRGLRERVVWAGVLLLQVVRSGVAEGGGAPGRCG